MPPPPDLSSYRLSDADSQRIFQEQILPATFPASASASSSSASASTRRVPLAVLTVGQTGAGKTLLAPAILRALLLSSTAPAPAHLIADTFKTYHPSYSHLPPAHASPATGPDARRWGGAGRAGGAVAARRAESLLRREAGGAPEGGDAAAADAAYGWEQGGAPGIARAVERERGRRLTEEERRTALEDVSVLEAHEDAKEQLEQVKVLLEPLMRERAQDETYPALEPLDFAQKDGDRRASNVLRLGYA
ncbi:zeta toxin family protein [Cordyceps fumosorosea ARSEF 2679]|uniref:Zeta toxin family protein n=1 Tax=Cordyceps fumosorosea (strain ARSEF 2679) TaxID=1081104 RepID=A0A168CEC5_CORFA|nr:zeta toxin family protein [Cordyceps fumosorosea ARSEF 2679]OAA71276.1 zeta toxin family protein [Cordyceps fumosorosea ARSEF 2679]